MIKKIISAYNKIFVVLPLGLAACLALIYIIGGWGMIYPNLNVEHFMLTELHDIDWYIFSIAVICILIYVAYCIYRKISSGVLSDNKKVVVVSIFLFIISFLIRFLLVFLYRESYAPFSDFSRVWEIANGGIEGNIEYYSLFSSYLNFSVFLQFICKLFHNQYVGVLYVNVFLSAVTTVLIYLIALKIGLDNSSSFFAAIIYAFYPSNIVYVTTGTPDFLTICFDSFGILFIVIASKKRNIKLRYLSFFVAGIMLGVGASFKSFSVVIIIAFIMAVIAENIILNGFKKI